MEQSVASQECPLLIEPNDQEAPSIAGISFPLSSTKEGAESLKAIKSTLGEALYEQLNWSVSDHGCSRRVAALCKQPMPLSSIHSIREGLGSSSIAADKEVISPLVLHELENQEPALFSYGEVGLPTNSYKSSWYWPLHKRLPKSAYKGAPIIRIFHADTGASRHPTLIGGINESESINFFSGLKGRAVLCWGTRAPEYTGHGTATAGIMVGAPSGNLTLHGMTPRGVVENIPCRVSEGIILYPKDMQRLADCLNRAVREGIKVVNISLGGLAIEGTAAIVPLTRAMKNAYLNGVIVCCASGQSMSLRVWPAEYAFLEGWCISCGPSDQYRAPHPMTAWWAFPKGYITIAAPGVLMPRASWKNESCSDGQPYITGSGGSSYATAFTASVAALWWARNYAVLSKMRKRDIVPLFRSIIQETCYRWDKPVGYGPGVLNPNGVLDRKL